MSEPFIAVFAGGTSAEREVSLGSGRACAQALARSFPTRLFVIDSDAIPAGLDPARHVVFSMLHGTFGEDGGMQRLLDRAGVSYSGCDALSCEVTMDKAFREVMQACATPGPKRRATWITNEFIEAYTELHKLGHAHSVECWQDEKLVGGVYGVAIGGLFAGESMFHRVSEASKVALFHLIEHLRRQGFELFDIQMLTPITRQLGGVTLPRKEYLRRLARAAEKRVTF